MIYVGLGALGLTLVGLAAVWAAWDSWKRYLVAIDRTAGLKALEAKLAERLAKLEANQAAHARALGGRAVHLAKQQADSA